VTALARRRGASPLEVESTSAGMRLRGTPLHLDARRVTDLSFVSHAHSDHIARHRRVVATAPTLALLTHRLGTSTSSSHLPAPFGQPFVLEGLRLELFPAGHVLGSAQLVVTRPDGRRIGYTGDFNPVPALAVEKPEIARCDVLVVESTFGHPRYRFPARDETYAAMKSFARRSLEQGATPVFLAYPLGKSQEAMAVLIADGLRICAHPSIADICGIYSRFGHPLPHRRFNGTVKGDEVLLLPPGKTPELEALPAKRTAVLTGWALDRGARFRFGTDEAFPLSDHGDFESMVGYVAQTGARRVVTVHGFAKELAACLRDRGFDATPLDMPRQLELF